MNNNGWIEWVYSPEKMYPETLDTKVLVSFRDGREDTSSDPQTVRFWREGYRYVDENYSNWYQNGSDYEIVAYKVVEQ